MREIVNWTYTINMRLIILIGLLSINWRSALSESAALPCHFLDSVNITDGILQPNKSYILNGMEFPVGQYAKINYTDEENQHIKVEPHIRGCLCNRMACVRYCCPYGKSYLKIINGKRKCVHTNDPWELYAHIYYDQNKSRLENFAQYFGHVSGSPCKLSYFLDEAYRITDVRISSNLSDHQIELN